MTTYLIPEADVDSGEFWKSAINGIESVPESRLTLTLLGYPEIDVEEAKKLAKIGDCLLFKYDDHLVPFQVSHKYDDGRVVRQTYYLMEKHMFDENTNVYKDSEIRRFLNEDVVKKMDPEFVNMIKPKQVHTDNYVTEDKLWLLSHEEIGYHDSNHMFKENVGAEVFDYYKDSESERATA